MVTHVTLAFDQDVHDRKEQIDATHQQIYLAGLEALEERQ